MIEPRHASSRRRLKPGSVPLLFSWNNFTLPSDSDSDTIEQEDPPMEVQLQYQDHDYCSSPVPSTVDLALERIADLEKQLLEMSISSKFGLERFAASDDDIRFYTR